MTACAAARVPCTVVAVIQRAVVDLDVLCAERPAQVAHGTLERLLREVGRVGDLALLRVDGSDIWLELVALERVLGDGFGWVDA